jgi:hypothetical protein
MDGERQRQREAETQKRRQKPLIVYNILALVVHLVVCWFSAIAVFSLIGLIGVLSPATRRILIITDNKWLKVNED